MPEGISEWYYSGLCNDWRLLGVGEYATQEEVGRV